MLSRHFLRIAQAPRVAAIRVTQVPAVRFYNPDQKGDTFDQAHQSGHEARKESKNPIDAATSEPGMKAPHDLKGNKEGLGFAEQVGSTSATGSNDLQKQESNEGSNGQEDITPPSWTDAVKSKLGFSTTAGEAKQNRGQGVGVTGTGQLPKGENKRSFHTSAVSWALGQTKGQAPEASRQPKESTPGEQNEHLKHKKVSSTPDSGQGNAAEEPTLPSHHVCAFHPM
jgi:hypothetical protein